MTTPDRSKGIGGSEAAAVVSLSPFCSAFELCLIKCGLAPEKPQTEAMRWGSVLEAPIAAEYGRRTGKTLRRAPAVKRSPRAPDFMFVSVDRMIVSDPRGPGYYEGKSLSAFTKLDDGLPEHIWLQLQHGLAVTGWKWGVVAMLLGGQRFEIREVERDQEAIDLLIDAEGEFMRRVELKDPPPPDGMASTGALLRRMYPEGSGRTIYLDGAEATVDAWNLLEAKAELKAWKECAAELGHRFQAAMQDAEIAILPGWGKVTWKTVRPEPKPICDFERLKAEEPAIYDRFVTHEAKRPYRRFLTHPLSAEEEDSESNE